MRVNTSGNDRRAGEGIFFEQEVVIDPLEKQGKALRPAIRDRAARPRAPARRARTSRLWLDGHGKQAIGAPVSGARQQGVRLRQGCRAEGGATIGPGSEGPPGWRCSAGWTLAGSVKCEGR